MNFAGESVTTMKYTMSHESNIQSARVRRTSAQAVPASIQAVKANPTPYPSG